MQWVVVGGEDTQPSMRPSRKDNITKTVFGLEKYIHGRVGRGRELGEWGRLG